MTSIFTGIEDFAPHYPLLGSTSWDRLSHFVQDEERSVLRNIVLGPQLHDALLQALEASLAEPTPTPLSAANAELLRLARSAVAPLSVYAGWKTLSVLFTSTGPRVNVTDDSRDAPMWLAEGARDAAVQQGYARIDHLVHHLLDHETDHPLWQHAPMRRDVRGSFVTTMTTVDRHTRILGGAWVLHHLRPAMRMVQARMVAAHMPAAQYTALLTKVHSAAPVFTSDEEDQLDMIRTAMVHGAMAEEAVSLALKKDHRGLFTLEGTSSKTRREAPANNDQVNALVSACQRRRDDALAELRRMTQPANTNENPPFGAAGGAFMG